jgi:hypothetical protein
MNIQNSNGTPNARAAASSQGGSSAQNAQVRHAHSPVVTGQPANLANAGPGWKRKILNTMPYVVYAAAGIVAARMGAAIWRGTQSEEFRFGDYASVGKAVLLDLPWGDDARVRQGHELVYERFKHYIPKDSLCFNAKQLATSEGLNPGEPGKFFPYGDGKYEVHVDPRYLLMFDMAAVHENVHCFTNPKFHNAYARRLDGISILEGFTQHLTGKVGLGSWKMAATTYDRDSLLERSRLPAHKGLPAATAMAAQVERFVGEHTLLSAFIKGDPSALRKVDDAIYNVWPQPVVAEAWHACSVVSGNRSDGIPRLQLAVESFVGALMVFAPERIDSLKLSQVLTREDLAALKDEAEKVRGDYMYFGSTFSKENVDDVTRARRLDKIIDKWTPVLSPERGKALVDRTV